jgi:hypothetical protein
MVVQEINMITKEVVEKQINLVPSSIGASFAILLNIIYNYPHKHY